MKFLVNMLWPDGTEELLDEKFDTEEAAEEAGCTNLSYFNQGNEILEMGGHDHMVGEADYEVIEVDE